MRVLPPPGPARGLALAQLANSVGDGAFFVTFALFFTRIVGLPAAQFGLGVSIGWIAGLLAGVPLGRLADRRGARGTAVTLAAVTAVSVLALLTVRTLPLFVVAMCVYGCGQTGLHAARQALLARVVAPELRTETRAYLQSTTNAGLALGASLGGIALWRDTGAAYATVLAADAAAFAMAALLLRRLPAVAPVVPTATRIRGALRDRPYGAVTLLYAVLLLNMPLLSWVLPLWIAERTDAPRGAVAAVLVLNTLSVALLQVRVARVVRDVATGVRAVRRAGLLLLVACGLFAASGAGSSPWLAALCLLVAAAFQVAGEMLQSAGGWQLSFDLAPPDRHGEYQGLFGSGVALARIVGPVLLTALVVTWGAPGWLVLGGLFALAAALMGPASRWALRVRSAQNGDPRERPHRPGVPDLPAGAGCGARRAAAAGGAGSGHA